MRLSQLTRAFQFRDGHVFVRLYVQYVRPHMEFAVPAWSPWLEGDKEVVEKFQKRAMQMVSGLKGKTYIERLKELGLLTLEERRHQPDIVQTYKIVTGKAMVNSETWFKSVTVTGRATRSAADPLNMRPQACRLETRRNFFSQRVVDTPNNILPP
jgi:ribonuclease P/MRP protein subunit RPP40